MKSMVDEEQVKMDPYQEFQKQFRQKEEPVKNETQNQEPMQFQQAPVV